MDSSTIIYISLFYALAKRILYGYVLWKMWLIRNHLLISVNVNNFAYVIITLLELPFE